MMISTFARESGLSIDTVRFYMRRGLLHPTVGRKGGSRPYRIFSRADLEVTRIIRIAQAMGLSLEEISSFLKGQAADETANSRLLAFLIDQRGRLARRVDELQRMISFLDAKMAWVSDPDGHVSPPFPL